MQKRPGAIPERFAIVWKLLVFAVGKFHCREHIRPAIRPAAGGVRRPAGEPFGSVAHHKKLTVAVDPGGAAVGDPGPVIGAHVFGRFIHFRYLHAFKS